MLNVHHFRSNFGTEDFDVIFFHNMPNHYKAVCSLIGQNRSHVLKKNKQTLFIYNLCDILLGYISAFLKMIVLHNSLFKFYRTPTYSHLCTTSYDIFHQFWSFLPTINISTVIDNHNMWTIISPECSTHIKN